MIRTLAMTVLGVPHSSHEDYKVKLSPVNRTEPTAWQHWLVGVNLIHKHHRSCVLHSQTASSGSPITVTLPASSTQQVDPHPSEWYPDGFGASADSHFPNTLLPIPFPSPSHHAGGGDPIIDQVSSWQLHNRWQTDTLAAGQVPCTASSPMS